MGFGTFTRNLIPKKIGFIGGPLRPPVEVPGQAQTQAQAGLPLIIQQLYGGLPFTPGADTMEGGFRTSPGFRPGSPMNINLPSTFAPGYGGSINNPGPRTADFRDFDGDGIDDRDQIGPGQPRVQSPGFSFGDMFGLGPMAQTTLADLSAFNPVANQYALAGFTVGEILAMPEFADFAQFQAEQAGGTATSAGLASLEAQLRDRGSPEDRPAGFGPRNPLLDNPTSMKFVDGKLVYDNVNPLVKTGIKSGDPVPGIPSALSAVGAFFRPGIQAVQNFSPSDFLSRINPFKQKQEEDKSVFNTIREKIAVQKKKEEDDRIARLNREKSLQDQKIRETEQKISDAQDDLRESYISGDKDNIKQAQNKVNQQKANKAMQQLGYSGAVATKSGPLMSKSGPVGYGGKGKKNGSNTGGGAQAGGGSGQSGPPAGSGSFCFAPNTLVQMADGSEKEIQNIKLGDDTKGGKVELVVQTLGHNVYNYKGVEVSGSHWVVEDGEYIEVETSKHAKPIDDKEMLYCLNTSNHAIWVKDIQFSDFIGFGLDYSVPGVHKFWESIKDKHTESIN